jgi:hypothetical protein
MANAPTFDLEAAHRYFSADCFNKAWALIDKTGRTPAEDEEMLRLSLASTWHWTQRADCTAENLSVGYWQTSRVYVLLKQVENARRYARLCLDTALGGPADPFYTAFGYEALARAEALAGDSEKKTQYLAEARRLAEQVSDPEDRGVLEADLSTIP